MLAWKEDRHDFEKRVFSVLVLFSGFCLAAETRGGLIPESGSYWNPKHNGEGAYLDVQGNKAALTLFSYDVEGRQVFYIAAGDMRSIPGGGQVGVGHYPLRALWADLYQTRNGPLFNPPPPNFRSKRRNTLIALIRNTKKCHYARFGVVGSGSFSARNSNAPNLSNSPRFRVAYGVS